MAFQLESVERAFPFHLDGDIEVESHDHGHVNECFINIERKSDVGMDIEKFFSIRSDAKVFSLNNRSTGGQLFLEITDDLIKIGIGLRN